MDETLYIVDEITTRIDPDAPSTKEIMDAIKDGGTPKAILVRIKATHAGKVNGNNYMYVHEGMRRSVKTWLKPYNKPILTHHDKQGDPIGRVANAEFIDINRSISDSDGNKQATGYISVLAKVSDQDAIEKILDGRYITVSIAGSARKVSCSICKQNIIKDGICEHNRGEVYDEKLCYWLIDGMEYKELSFVNVPADTEAMAEAVETTDSVVESASFVEETTDGGDKREERPVAKKTDVQGQDSTEDQIEDLSDGWSDEDLQVLKDEEHIYPEDKDDSSDSEKDTKDEESEVEDKKNSDDQLSKDSFCGPSRSFPVPDCAHAGEAKAHLGKSKLSDSAKKKVLSGIVGKQKSLGCSGFDKAAEGASEEITNDDLLTALLNEISYSTSLVDNLQDAEKRVGAINDIVDGISPDGDNEDILKTAMGVIKEQNDVLKAEVVKLNDAIKNHDEVVEAMTDKYQDALIENRELYASRLVDLRIQMRKSDMSDVLGADGENKKLRREAHIQEFAKRSIESLRDGADDLAIEMVDFIGEPTESPEANVVVRNSAGTFTMGSRPKRKKDSRRSPEQKTAAILFGDEDKGGTN